jgi:hypothetical protein
MISSVWGLWFWINIFNVVVLLNFLIAFISDTYTEVFGRKDIDAFKNMALLNNEYEIIVAPFKTLFRTKVK